MHTLFWARCRYDTFRRWWPLFVIGTTINGWAMGYASCKEAEPYNSINDFRRIALHKMFLVLTKVTPRGGAPRDVMRIQDKQRIVTKCIPQFLMHNIALKFLRMSLFCFADDYSIILSIVLQSSFLWICGWWWKHGFLLNAVELPFLFPLKHVDNKNMWTLINSLKSVPLSPVVSML